MNKKGQALSIQTIVIAIIAIVVLVIIVAFATGSLGQLFGQTRSIGTVASVDDISNFQLQCQNSCNRAKELTNSKAQWKTSAYCRNNLGAGVDKNNDGIVGGLDSACTLDSEGDYALVDGVCTSERNTQCWDASIGSDCTVEFDETTGGVTKRFRCDGSACGDTTLCTEIGI